ncbi:hypothetical protein LTR40_013676, partial [Exophiala xenobiotica]
TILSHSPLRRSRKSSGTMSCSTAASSVKSSPSSSFSSFGDRVRMQALEHLNTAVSPILSTSRPSNFIRRQPSAIDMALEEEMYADPVELIGLGLLEPRPRANTGASTPSSQCSMMEFMSESMQGPVVLDGIFEVMERA